MATKKTAKRMGRPPLPEHLRRTEVHLRMRRDVLDAVDRMADMNCTTRTQAIEIACIRLYEATYGKMQKMVFDMLDADIKAKRGTK